MTEFVFPAASVLFAVTIAVSLIALFRMPALIDRLAMRPYFIARGRLRETVIASGFIHADLGHLLFNMFTFYFFAFPMEEFLGSVQFAVLYLIGLLLSNTCSIVKHRNNAQYASIGASGAISAVLFAYIVYFPTTTLIIFPLPVPVPAFLFAFGYVGYSFWASQQHQGRVNHDAHLCGALSGIAFVMVTDPRAFTDLASMF